MHAVAALAVAAGAVRVLETEPPLVLRRTDTRAGGAVRVHLVAAAGGPCQGDELRLVVRVADGAALELRSTAATVALPGRAGGTSTWRTEVEVGAGATLVWKPEPTVAAAGSDHVADTVVRLAPTATLLLREELVTGRSREHRGGRLRAGLRVERAGGVVYDQEIALGRGPLLGPGIRAVGTLVVVGGGTLAGQRLLPNVGGGAGGDVVVSALAAPAAYAATALAPDTVVLRRLLRRAEALLEEPTPVPAQP